MPPRDHYLRCIARFDSQISEYQSRFRQLGNLRLLTALLIAATAIASWGMGLLSPWFVLAPMGGLLGLTVALDRVERAQAEAVRAQGYYRVGLARLNGDWQGQGNPGENFRQADHLFADDVDLFGRGSLFEYLCVARTAAGEKNLAKWLMQPAEPAIAKARQTAVSELATCLPLREDLALIGDDVRGAVNDDEVLRTWGEAPAVPFPVATLWVARLLALVAAIAVFGWLGQMWPITPFLLIVLAELLFSARFRERVEQVHTHAGRPARELRLIRIVLERIARENFEEIGRAHV